MVPIRTWMLVFLDIKQAKKMAVKKTSSPLKGGDLNFHTHGTETSAQQVSNHTITVSQWESYRYQIYRIRAYACI